jgi:hypothetical protein
MAHDIMHSLIEAASKAAEQWFDRRGRITPVWYAIDEDGNHLVIPPPTGNKDQDAILIRAVFEIRKVRVHVFVSEAWIVTAKDREKLPVDGSLADHPDRAEIIYLLAEDRDGGSLAAQRLINRPTTGKASLGPLEFAMRPDPSRSGRFQNMLGRPASLN